MTLRLSFTQVLFIIVALLFAVTTLTVSAQGGAGVRISPAIIEETLEPGQTVTYEYEIENLNPVEQQFFLFTRNISGVSSGGAPIFADNNFEKTGYALADWITLPVGDVTLQAGESRKLDFTLTVPADAKCSHFGGVFVSAQPPEIENSGAAVGYQVANIVSIRINGECDEIANIRQFSTGKFLYGSQNVDFNVRIENSGDVLVRPTGPLEITNSLGRTVGSMAFNDDRAGIFPGETREFDDVNWIGDGVGFGRYEVVLSAVYGENGARKTMSSTVTFWVLPLNIIGPAAAVLGILLLITVIGVRIYIKRTLAQLSTGRRLVRQRGQQNSSTTLLMVVTALVVVALFLLIMLVLFA
jgi:hypothetical protein